MLLFALFLVLASASRTRFEEVAHQWGLKFPGDKAGLYDLYAPDAKVSLQFQGLPPSVDISVSQAMDGFFAMSKAYDFKFKTLVESSDTLVFHFVDWVETTKGCRALFTGVATFHFNADAKIVRHQAWSDDTQAMVKCISEYSKEL